MATKQIKTCQACKTFFKGRKDAKTCSVACRKRLQRGLKAQAAQRAARLESALGREFHRIAASLMANHVVHEPYVLADERGGVPVSVLEPPHAVKRSLDEHPDPVIPEPGTAITPGTTITPAAAPEPTMAPEPMAAPESLETVPQANEPTAIPTAAPEAAPAQQVTTAGATSTAPTAIHLEDTMSTESLEPSAFGNAEAMEPADNGDEVPPPKPSARERFLPFHYNKLALTVTGLALLLITVIGGGSLFLSARHNQPGKSVASQPGDFAVTNLPLGQIKANQALTIGEANQVTINGQLTVSQTLVIAPTGRPTAPVRGQIYYDQATNQPYYYDGTQFISLAPQIIPQSVTSIGGASGVIDLGNGLSVVNNQLSVSGSFTQQITQQINNAAASGVLSLTGTANQVNVSSSTGHITLSLPQSIAAASTPTFGGLTLSNLSTGLVLSNGAGTLSSGTVDRNNASYLTGTLSAANGGTGAASFTGNGIIYGNGAGALQVTNSLANATLVTSAGGVPSLSQTLPLQVQDNITHTGVLSSGSITAGFGAIATVNNISTTAQVQAGSLQIDGGTFTIDNAGNFVSAGTGTIQGAGGLTIGVANTTTGSLKLANSGNIHYTILQGLAPAGTDQTVTIPNSGLASDTVCLLTMGNCVGVGGAVSASGGIQNYITKFTNAGGTQIGNSLLFDNGTSVGVGTALPSASYLFDINGNLHVSGTSTLDNTLTITAGGAGITGNIGQSGTGTFSTGTGNVSLNGATTVTGTNTFNVGTGATTLGGVLNVTTGLATLSGGASITNGATITGLTNINISGTANTYIGNATGTLGLASAAFNVTTAGALSGITGYIQSSGNFSQSGVGTFGTGTGAVSLNGATTVSSTLTVQGAGGITVGVAGATAGTINLANGTNTNLSVIQSAAPSGVGNATYNLPSIVGGTSDNICLVTLGNCTGSGTGVTGSGTIGTLAVFTGGQAIGNSVITQSGSAVTVTGTLAVTGASSLTLGTSLANTGSLILKNSTNSNTLTLQSGATASNLSFTLPTADGSNGDCIQTNGFGAWSFQTCTGGPGGGVTSVNSQTGIVTIANSSGGSGIVTIDNAVANGVTKGIATFNATNFTDNGSGVINTIQDISIASSPVFVSPNATTGINTGAGVGIQRIDSSGNLVNIGTITTSGAINTATITGGSLSSTAVNGLSVSGGTITNPTIAGTVTGSGSPTITGFGSISAGTYNSQTISSAANFTGTVTIQGASALTLGTASTNTGAITFKGSGGAGTLTLQGPTTPNIGNFTLTIPAITGNANVCTDNSICGGYAPSSGGNYIAKNAADTSSASVAGNLLGLTNTNTGAAGVLSLTNWGTNSALSILQSGTSEPSALQALILANNNTTTPTGNLLDLQNKGTSELHVDVSGNLTTIGNIQGTNIVSTSTITVGTLGTTNTSTALCRNATNIISGCSTTGAGAAFVQGGNSFAATATLGTNDSNSLAFETNNVTQATIAVGGATTFKNSSNSTSAFQVQNAAGTAIFNVDTTNAKIGTPNVSGASTNSRPLTVASGDATGATSNSGNLTVSTGSATGTPGNIAITTGVGATTSGAVSISTANTSSGVTPGNITLQAGDIASGSADNTQAGTVNIYAGDAGDVSLGVWQAGNGGDVNIAAGAGGTDAGCNCGGDGAGGDVNITGGGGTSGNVAPGDVVLKGGYTGVISGSVIVKSNTVNSTAAFQIQNAAGTSLLTANTTGGLVALGTSSSLSGNLKFLSSSGTGSISVVPANPGSSNYTLTLPAETGTLCSTGSVCAGYAASSGSGSYIQNGTTIQTNANFAIQSAAAGSIGGVIKGAVSQTADLLQFQNSAGAALSKIDATGDLLAGGVATATTGTTTGTGTNTTTLTLTADAFSVNDVVFIDNAGQDYYTRITVDPGSGSYTVSPAVTFETGRTVTKYTIQNIGATTTDYTTQANRFFQGYFTGGVVTGAGSTTLSDGSLASTTAMNFNSPSYTFKNTSDSATSFQIQNTGGTSLLTADTTNLQLTTGNLESTGTLSVKGPDGGSILIGAVANSGTGANAMTFSGNEITDKTRATNTQGDGRQPPDSSTGIWEGTTNLVTNGGLESNTTGWAVSGGGAFARDTSLSKFGIASVKAGTSGGNNGLYAGGGNRPNVTVGLSYTLSAWVYAGAAGSTISPTLVWTDAVNGTGSTISASVNSVALTQGVWQRVSVTGTAPATAVSVIVTLYVSNTSTNYFDGIQIEQKPVATPYVETDGGTASRTAARVQAPASNLNTTQGWFATRVRLGVSSAAAPAYLNVLDWQNSSSNRYGVYWQKADSKWYIQSTNAGIVTSTGVSGSFNSGDYVTLVVYWTSSGVAISVNGSAFTIVSGGTRPTITSTTFDIGSYQGGQQIDSDMMWTATGTGILSDADAAALNRLGNSDPSLAGINTIDSAATPTFAWNGESTTYTGTNNTATLQSGITLDDTTLYRSGAGALTIQGNTNSTTAFQIQNAAGTSIFTADTTNSQVAIGPAAVPANGVLTVGTNTTAATGGIYFGTDTNLYRSAADTLKTDDSLVVGTNLSVTGTINSAGLLTGSAGATISGGTINLNASGTNVTNINTGASGGAVNVGSTSSGLVTLQSGTSVDVGTTGTATSLNVHGATLFKNVTDSTTAFQVQNANAGSLLNVDTSNNKITLNGLNSGELGAWATTTAMPITRQKLSTVVANGYIYEIGGSTSASVRYAKLNANGTVGTWSTSSAYDLPLARQDAVVVTGNGYLYVIGGYDGAASVKTTYYAKINSDGSLGTWETDSPDIPAVRSDAKGFVANGYVYVTGGVDNTPTVQSTIYYAKLNANGTTGAWATNTGGIGGTSVARALHTAVAANGYAYIVGGIDGTPTTQTTVYYGKLNLDGTITGWGTGTAMTSALDRHTSTVANGYLYAIGGESTYNGTKQTNVYYAALNGDGSIGSWATSGSSLPVTLMDHATATANGYVYVLGGNNGSVVATVYYSSLARLQVGGSLDLVGLGGQNLAEGGTGGTLTAGNTNIIGGLVVQDQATFAQGLSVDKDLVGHGSVLFQNATDSTTAFQIQNATGATSLFTADTSNTRIGIGGTPATSLLTIGTATTAASGGITFGTDTNLYRNGANVLKTDGGLIVAGGNFDVTGGNIRLFNGGANPQIQLVRDGSGTPRIEFGVGGASATDVNLYRSAAGELTTNGDLVVQGGDLTTNQTTFNLFNTTATTLNIGGAVGAGGIVLAGGSGSTGCTLAGDTGNFTCAGTITGTTLNGTTGINTGAGAGTQRIDSSGNLVNTGNITFASGNKTLQIADAATLNITDGTNNLLTARDLSTNFGMALDAGAFIDRNSSMQQEFNTSRTTISADAALTQGGGMGDGGGWNGYEGSTTPNCTFSTVDSGTNGYVNINANASATSACLLTLDTLTINTPNKLFTVNNLPVALMKIRPSVQPGTAQNLWAGFAGATDGSGSSGMPDPSLGFLTSTFSSTNVWQFGSLNAGGGSAVCSGSPAVLANKWALLEMVVRTTTAVDFYIDNDVSNGVNLTFCGTRTTSIPTANLAPQVNWNNVTATAGTLDVDFIRVWQDDPLTLDVTPTQNQTLTIQADPININASSLANGASITQMYPSDSPNMEPGTVASLDTASGVFKVKPSDKDADTDLVGVVANDPGLDLNNGSFDGVRVATGGRTRVKVSGESIALGDYITSSTKPGFAKKATGPGQVLGRALEGFNGQGDGMITVSVEPGYNNGANNTALQQDNVNFASLIAGAATIDNLNAANATVNTLEVTGAATLADLTVTGSAQFAGNITVGGHVITAGGQPTSEAQVAAGGSASVAVDGTDTTGTITITTGSAPSAGDLAKILFSKTYGSAPHIVLSPSNGSAAGLRFYKGTTSSTDFMFDAQDTPVPNTTYTFDYFIAQ